MNYKDVILSIVGSPSQTYTFHLIRFRKHQIIYSSLLFASEIQLEAEKLYGIKMKIERLVPVPYGSHLDSAEENEHTVESRANLIIECNFRHLDRTNTVA